MRTRKVGSSSAKRLSAAPILSWSARVFGSIETEITGSGKLIDSSTIGLRRIAERVAGERVLQADDGADIAGANRLNFFAVVRMHPQQRPIRSRSPLVEFSA